MALGTAALAPSTILLEPVVIHVPAVAPRIRLAHHELMPVAASDPTIVLDDQNVIFLHA